MFVSALTIKDYKCFKSETLEGFNVPDGSPGSGLNVFLGENGTGLEERAPPARCSLRPLFPARTLNRRQPGSPEQLGVPVGRRRVRARNEAVPSSR